MTGVLAQDEVQGGHRGKVRVNTQDEGDHL